MNCREWKERIAGEPDDPAAARHVRECAACRGFARGLRAAIAELQAAHAEEIAEAHYAAVRARVMAELRPRRRWGWAWAAAGVAAVAMGIGVRVASERMRVEELPVVARAPRVETVAAASPGRRMPARTPAWRAGGSLHEEIVMKIETGDPDVVIYWIAEAKGEY